jgi:hypothetical protein
MHLNLLNIDPVHFRLINIYVIFTYFCLTEIIRFSTFFQQVEAATVLYQRLILKALAYP